MADTPHMAEADLAGAQFMAAVHMAARIGEQALAAGVEAILLTAAGVGDVLRMATTLIVIGAGDYP